MKKILLTIVIILTAIISQAQVKGQTVEATQYFKLKTNIMRYFYTITPDDTLVSKSYVDGLISGLAGGHDPVSIGMAGTAAGLSISGQEINMQPATAAQNGYLPASAYTTFNNKLSTVSHNNTLTGSGTALDPLKADTAIMAARAWVLNQNYINESELTWDSITDKPPIPVISDIAYGATWDSNTDGASKNAIYDKIESLAGGHDILTLTDSALYGGLSLDTTFTQLLNFQRASLSQNGYMDSYTYGQVAISAKVPSAFTTANAITKVSAAGRNIVQSGVLIDASNNMSLPGTLTSNGNFAVQGALTNGGMDFNANGTGSIRFVTAPSGTGSYKVYVGAGATPSHEITSTGASYRHLIGTGNRMVITDANGNITAAKKDSISFWNTAYGDKINSLAVTGTTTKTITLTQQDGGTVTGSFTDLSSTVNSYKLLAGTVTDRNIDVTLTNYVPANYDMISVLPDMDIATGDTITLSVNGGTKYNIFGKTSYADSLAMTLAFRNNTWFLLGSSGEEYVVTGTNTGDQEFIANNGLSVNNDTIQLGGVLTKDTTIIGDSPSATYGETFNNTLINNNSKRLFKIKEQYSMPFEADNNYGIRFIRDYGVDSVLFAGNVKRAFENRYLRFESDNGNYGGISSEDELYYYKDQERPTSVMTYRQSWFNEAIVADQTTIIGDTTAYILHNTDAYNAEYTHGASAYEELFSLQNAKWGNGALDTVAYGFKKTRTSTTDWDTDQFHSDFEVAVYDTIPYFKWTAQYRPLGDAYSANTYILKSPIFNKQDLELTIPVSVNGVYADSSGNINTQASDTLFTTIAISDETTALTVGTAKRTFRMPFACTLTKVRASVATAPTGATLIFDIKEGGSTVLSTLLSIDAGEKTSKTATSAAVISDSSLADDAEMTIDITQIGSTVAGAGAKIVLYYVKN